MDNKGKSGFQNKNFLVIFKFICVKIKLCFNSNEDHEPTQSHSISREVNQVRSFHVHRREDPYRSLKQTMRRLERGTKKN